MISWGELSDKLCELVHTCDGPSKCSSGYLKVLFGYHNGEGEPHIHVSIGGYDLISCYRNQEVGDFCSEDEALLATDLYLQELEKRIERMLKDEKEVDDVF